MAHQSSSTPQTSDQASDSSYVNHRQESSSQQPSQPDDPWEWLPRFQILRLPPGAYSPRTDERCFSYCSQTSRGRTEHAEPSCRTFCIRFVRAHEVEKRKMPLPPEGQPKEAVANGQVGGVGAKDVKNWEEGWYLWTTKSRWATQEKLDMLRLNLEQQTDWMRKKEISEKQREEEAQNKATGYQVPPKPKQQAESSTPPPQRRPAPMPPLPNFSQFTAQSMLIPLSPLPSETYDMLRKSYGKVLNPTSRILETLQESISNGSQWSLAQNMWEKALNGDAFVLARNVMETAKEKLKNFGDDDDDDDEKTDD
ncbi:hypothetical protein SISNIDRAFT_419961 [Sistotremastrum niveocremeum HHB9708]|uniref:Uncharacterized protein n=1 Tax=Sistotremastrum niveocremeum HHB9708 TaxID=1314777 RepID=A0A164MZ06_9AGAM|nr:hypothetical protein SISNIDRAFT_419961 [Sistotremastrum niveocremeum HHB9708]